MFSRFRLRNYDFKLVLLVIAVSTVGVLAVGSAEPSLRSKQLIGVVFGVCMMLFISLFDYNWVLKFYWLMYLFNLVLLGLVHSPLGSSANGAQRWIQITESFKFQPSETAKILLILFFAQFIMKNREKFNTIRVIGSCIVLIGIPWGLIITQPDLSTSLVLAAVFCIIMFAGGLSFKVVFGVLAIAVPALAIVVSLALQPDQTILKDYQQDRILAFIYPEEYADKEAYQQINSVTAIASGMLDGKGYNNNEITSVVNGNFISEPQTDFIFAVIGEEFGFKGSIVVVVLLMGIALECIGVARKAKDLAGTIIAAGMGGLIGIQSFVNLGVVTFILPNTGLPLPFISYGLTSLLSLFMGMGFVLNVKMQGKR